MKKLIILFFIIFNSFYSEQFKQMKFLMGTIMEITVEESNKEKAISSIELAFKEIERLEKMMSKYDKESELSKINQSKKPMVISKEMAEIIKETLKFTILTNGAFDITVQPILKLWKLAAEKNCLPQKKEIQKNLALVGSKNIILKNNTIDFKKQGIEIDLGGMAQGYAADKATEILKKIGIKQFLINAGGEIYGTGKKWKIGIQHPRQKNNLIGTIEIQNKGISTSGDYERYFEIQNKKYCHIINPVTGMPVKEVISVTIIANTATESDILSTAVCVLGKVKGIKLIESLPNVEGLIITENNGKIDYLISKNFKQKYNLIIFEQ